MDSARTIGRRLRRLREERGWSQYELAREANTTNVTVGRLERGETAPRLKTAMALAKALEVDVNDLLGTDLAREDQLERIEATVSQLQAQLAYLTELLEGEGVQLPGPPEGGPIPLRSADGSPSQSTDEPGNDSDT